MNSVLEEIRFHAQFSPAFITVLEAFYQNQPSSERDHYAELVELSLLEEEHGIVDDLTWLHFG